MCGRFSLHARPEDVAEHFDLDATPELSPRYNIAPSQQVAAVRAADSGDARVLEMRSWGLVPGWAKDPAIGNRLINARAETVAEKPAFRSAFRRRRCLIPADGFYEWAPGSSPKQPWFITRGEGVVFAFAGLWEDWRSPEGAELHSCTILTTRANATLAAVHDRMPVILDPADYVLWLDPASKGAAAQLALLAPCPDTWLTRHTVGLRVNNPRHDDPDCAAQAGLQPNQASLL
jgi:putative SOS response-associated peptidase YedK